MSDELKHECGVAMVVLKKPPAAAGDYGGTKLSLLLEKQHNRGQDGAGAAILRTRPVPGEEPYWIAKTASSTPLADVLGAIARRDISRREKDAAYEDVRQETGDADGSSRASSLASSFERIFLGHLRYATFGKNETAFCHPFVHESSELAHTLLLAGNFNLTNAHELFDDYARHGSFPTSKSDGYLVCELIAHEIGKTGLLTPDFGPRCGSDVGSPMSEVKNPPIAAALSKALANADGAWTLCGATGDGWAFATRDPCGIRPGFYYIDENAVVVASERPAIQAAFDAPPEAVKELPPGSALVVSPEGEIAFESLDKRLETMDAKDKDLSRLPSDVSRPASIRPCSFERIYFSRANDAAIHRERKALGAALLPQILKAAGAPLENIFFSYIPNSARIAFHGLLEELFSCVFSHKERKERKGEEENLCGLCDLCGKNIPRFGEVIVKDAKFRTFIADAAARREFYKHVYDVTYGLVKENDTLVVLDDSIVRGNTMKNAILPMLDRLGPKRIVIASSAPPIRYPDCYGIDMSTLGELVAFKALVNLMDGERELSDALNESKQLHVSTCSTRTRFFNPLAPLYARFTDEQHCAEIARLLTPPGMKAEVKVVYQTVENLRKCLGGRTDDKGQMTEDGAATFQLSTCNFKPTIGDWYFTGDYPTPGGYKVLHKALENYLEQKSERSY